MCSTIAKIGSPSWLRTVSPRMRPRRRISSRSGKSLSGESSRAMITRIQNMRPLRRPRIRRRPSGWAFVLEPRPCTTNPSDAWSGPLATHTTSHYNYRRRVELQGRRNRLWSSATPNPHQCQRRGRPSRGVPYVKSIADGGSAAPSWFQNDPRRCFASLSRRKQGFESPRERQLRNQTIDIQRVVVSVCHFDVLWFATLVGRLSLNGLPCQPLLICGAGVTLDFGKGLVSGDRSDFARRTSSFSKPPRCCLSKAVRFATLRQPGFPDGCRNHVAEALQREGIDISSHQN